MSESASSHSLTRRDLLKTLGVVGVAAATPDLLHASENSPAPAESMIGVPFEQRDVLRVAIVGTGLRGSSVLNEFLAVDGVRVTALCDIVPAKAQRAAAAVVRAGQPEPALYTDGERAFEKLVQRDDIDLVYTATPWQWHTPVCLAAMKAGKHAASECPIGSTEKELWELVDTSEKTRKHCLQLENCCYDSNEMMINNMVKQGKFGEVLYAEGAYNHDLRSILFENRDEGLWRRFPHTNRAGNFYPTHGLGPVAWYLDINGKDRFDYLVSMSTQERGLTEWREAHEPANSPKWQERYTAGDINTSLLKTVKGKTVVLQHMVTLPTPYDRLNSVRGTKGVFKDYPARFYFEGQAGGERFLSSGPAFQALKEEFTHPLWKKVGDIARQKGGHGGMDYIMAWRLAECFHLGIAPDFDVYDAATWSVPWPLSEKSLKDGSKPIKFPDFTRGNWNRGASRG